MNKESRFWQAIKSAASAMFGVQNSNNHRKDFESETPFPFILAGVILVISLLFIVAAVVKAVVP
jgi:hypothetical protein